MAGCLTPRSVPSTGRVAALCCVVGGTRARRCVCWRRTRGRPSASNRHPAISARSTYDPGSSSTGASRNARRRSGHPGRLAGGFRELPGPRASQLESSERLPVPPGFQGGPALRRSCSGSQSSRVATVGLWSLKAYTDDALSRIRSDEPEGVRRRRVHRRAPCARRGGARPRLASRAVIGPSARRLVPRRREARMDGHAAAEPTPEVAHADDHDERRDGDLLQGLGSG
jgi:hypothetical protein